MNMSPELKKSLSELNPRLLMQTRRFLVIAVGVAGVSLLLVVGAIWPMVQQLFGSVAQYQTDSTKLVQLQKKVRGLNDLASVPELTQSPKVDVALPSQKPLLQLMASINAVAEQTQVSVDDIETSPGRLASGSGRVASGAQAGAGGRPAAPAAQTSQVYGVDTLTIAIKLTGTLDKINTFIKQIEHTSPMANVTQIQLQEIPLASTTSTQTSSKTASNVTPERQFSADLELTSYYFTRAIQVAVDEPLPETTDKDKTFLTSLESYLFPDVQSYQAIQGGGRQNLFEVTDQSPAQSQTQSPLQTQNQTQIQTQLQLPKSLTATSSTTVLSTPAGTASATPVLPAQ